MEHRPAYTKLIIQKIIEEATDAKTFELRTENGSAIKYQPGQFATFVFPKKNDDDDRRSYSFSSTPLLNETAAITVKRIANGTYSRQLMQAKEGDELLLAGISGFFTLPENPENFQQLFFIAAGSGITPIFSLIKTALHVHHNISIVLIYSNRNRGSTIFYKELIHLSEQFPDRFKVHFLFSDSMDILKARLSNYLLIDLLDQSRTDTWQKIYFFICGPFDYMDTVMITLLTEGVPKDHIRKENFNSSTPEIKLKPPDRRRHTVTIRQEANNYELEVQFPDSILDQALKQNIPLPYSCKSGQCGSCTAICLKGKVWMSYNEVLTDKELNEGMILTCTGFPVDGDVVITF